MLFEVPVVLHCCWEVAWKRKRSSVVLQPRRRQCKLLLNQSWAQTDLSIIHAGLSDCMFLNVKKKEKLMWFAMSLQRLKEKKKILGSIEITLIKCSFVNFLFSSDFAFSPGRRKNICSLTALLGLDKFVLSFSLSDKKQLLFKLLKGNTTFSPCDTWCCSLERQREGGPIFSSCA